MTLSANGQASWSVESSLSLLSLPGSWLRDFVLHPELDSSDIACLFQTCRHMRDLVLAMRNVVVRVDLRREAAKGQAHLLLACKLSSKVKLMLSNLPAKGRAIAPAPELGAVFHVTLNYAYLDSLVPSWLPSTFPNMTSLTLHSCSVKRLPSTHVRLPACTRLQRLQLAGCRAEDDGLDPARWRHQFGALTGLTSYSVQGLHQLPDWESTITAAVRSQLIELSLADDTVNDGRMEALLGMPLLKRLTCYDVQLQQSYTQRPCTWTHLEVHGGLDITSFSRLPLRGIQVTHHGETIIPSHDLATNTRVVRDLISSGVRCMHDAVRVDNGVEGADAACMVALRPLLYTRTGR